MTFINTGAIVALYISIFIITKKQRSRGDYILFIYFILNALVFAIVSLSFNLNEPDLLFFIINIDMLTTPVWYLYFGRLALNIELKKSTIIKHLFPYFLTLIILIIYGEVVGSREFERLLELPILDQPLILTIISLWELLVVPFYIIQALRVLKKYREGIKYYYSFKKGVDLVWLAHFLSLHFIGWVAIYILYWLKVDNSLITGISINGFLLLYLGYFGIRETQTIYHPEKYKKSSIESSFIQGYINRVKQVMEEDKPYLDPELNLEKLSDITSIPNHKLSQVLSQGFKMSFYEVVNGYRVEEFKKRALLPQNRGYTLLSIAMDSGFNSKSSFNRIFKDMVKVTPRDFLSQNLDK